MGQLHLSITLSGQRTLPHTWSNLYSISFRHLSLRLASGTLARSIPGIPPGSAPLTFVILTSVPVPTTAATFGSPEDSKDVSTLACHWFFATALFLGRPQVLGTLCLPCLTWDQRISPSNLLCALESWKKKNKTIILQTPVSLLMTTALIRSSC